MCTIRLQPTSEANTVFSLPYCCPRFLLFVLLRFVGSCVFLFFFNDTATTEIYTLSLHDALPILTCGRYTRFQFSILKRELLVWQELTNQYGKHVFCLIFVILTFLDYLNSYFISIKELGSRIKRDRKSTRLNSSHQIISYAVFCLK